jgi:hypothetical protein
MIGKVWKLMRTTRAVGLLAILAALSAGMPANANQSPKLHLPGVAPAASGASMAFQCSSPTVKSFPVSSYAWATARAGETLNISFTSPTQPFALAKHFASCTLSVYANGKSAPALTITITNAIVSSLSYGTAAGKPEENVGFRYSSVKIVYAK